MCHMHGRMPACIQNSHTSDVVCKGLLIAMSGMLCQPQSLEMLHCILLCCGWQSRSKGDATHDACHTLVEVSLTCCLPQHRWQFRALLARWPISCPGPPTAMLQQKQTALEIRKIAMIVAD